MFSEIRKPFWHPALMKGFILDWDGVLADTQLNFAPLRQKYFGGKLVPLLESAARLSPLLRDEVCAEIRRVEMDGAERARPIPGALELIRWLNERGISWVVVSRNCRDSILLAATRCEIDLPRHVLSREDPAVKPEPEALHLAAKLMGVPLENCLMVGDFIYDLLGARRAGIRCVLVERTTAEWKDLADVAYDTMEDFLSALQATHPLIPWEYREIARRRGTAEAGKYLQGINRSIWLLPPNQELSWALKLAKCGVTDMALSRTAKLSLAEWENSHLPAHAIDRPLLPLLNGLLSAHWPCAKVHAAEELSETSCVSIPEGSNNPDSFLENVVNRSETS